MQQLADRLPGRLVTLRVALAAFVLIWLFGPYTLRAWVPVWLVFAVAVGLELYFFAGALSRAPVRRPDRGPQEVDRERYGYVEGGDDLLLVRRGGEELWIPYAGEKGEELEALVDEARERREEEMDAAAVRQQEPRSRWLPVRRFLVALCVIGAVAAVLWVIESRRGWDGLDADTKAAAAARFSEEASLVAAKPVTISCDEAGEHVGVVQHADGAAVVGGEVGYLTPERCHDLYRLAFEGEVTGSQTARAVAVLAHESWHLRGVADEGTTECYALQSGVELGQRLGLSEDDAAQMMRQQLVENAGRGAGSIEYVVPPECRNGAGLDLNSGTDRFP
jgi:hypothetical protein